MQKASGCCHVCMYSKLRLPCPLGSKTALDNEAPTEFLSRSITNQLRIPDSKLHVPRSIARP